MYDRKSIWPYKNQNTLKFILTLIKVGPMFVTFKIWVFVIIDGWINVFPEIRNGSIFGPVPIGES